MPSSSFTLQSSEILSKPLRFYARPLTYVFIYIFVFSHDLVYIFPSNFLTYSQWSLLLLRNLSKKKKLFYTIGVEVFSQPSSTWGATKPLDDRSSRANAVETKVSDVVVYNVLLLFNSQL